MRIDAFLNESPMFAVNRAARRFESLTTQVLAGDSLGFLEGLVLAAMFFEAPLIVKPSQLAETFATTRGNVSHCVSSLEAKGLLQRKIDPADARAYLLTLKPQGKKCALRVIGAFDRLQKEFENEVGKASLSEMLKTIRKLEALFAVHPVRLGANEALIHFDRANSHRLYVLVFHHMPQALQHEPCRLLRNVCGSCDLIGGHAILAVAEQPHYGQPDMQL